MAKKITNKNTSHPVCGQIGPGDGVDPKEWARLLRRTEVSGRRKSLQLCGQVAQILNTVLSDDGRDELLLDWFVERVEPVPNSSTLMVCLTPLHAELRTPISHVLNRLAAQKGRLRRAVATGITRRKTPDLLFRIVSTPEIDHPETDGEAI